MAILTHGPSHLDVESKVSLTFGRKASAATARRAATVKKKGAKAKSWQKGAFFSRLLLEALFESISSVSCEVYGSRRDKVTN